MREWAGNLSGRRHARSGGGRQEWLRQVEAAFCAASVEWLCQRYNVPCPSWVDNPTYKLAEPWFDSPGAHKPEVRTRLIQKTPEPFTRRNIFCGDRMFANKYELAEQHRRRSA